MASIRRNYTLQQRQGRAAVFRQRARIGARWLCQGSHRGREGRARASPPPLQSEGASPWPRLPDDRRGASRRRLAGSPRAFAFGSARGLGGAARFGPPAAPEGPRSGVGVVLPGSIGDAFRPARAAIGVRQGEHFGRAGLTPRGWPLCAGPSRRPRHATPRACECLFRPLAKRRGSRLPCRRQSLGGRAPFLAP